MAVPPSPNLSTLRLLIYGRVQGVFFRQSMQREAQYQAVAGWVRNRSDGSVEAVVQGEPGAVEAMVRWAKTGPQRAQVERVDIAPASGSFSDFAVID